MKSIALDLKRVSSRQLADIVGQLVCAWHLGAADNDRYHQYVFSLQRGGNFDPDEVCTVVDAPIPALIMYIEPVGTDDRQEDIALRNLLIEEFGKGFSLGDVVDVDEYPPGRQTAYQPVMNPAGPRRTVFPTVVDKNVSLSGGPPSHTRSRLDSSSYSYHFFFLRLVASIGITPSRADYLQQTRTIHASTLVPRARIHHRLPPCAASVQ